MLVGLREWVALLCNTDS